MRPAWTTALMLLVMSACGNARPGGDRFAQYVVDSFMADCERPHSPTPALARELHRLCACTGARIFATGIAFGDSDDATNAKVQAAMRACDRDVHGAVAPRR
jgi:hypothetical protein